MSLIVQSWVRNGWAVWASRLAVFAIQLVLVTFILHRVHVIGTPLGLGLLVACEALAVLGGFVALIAIVQIWQNGGRGGLRSSFAILVALLALAGPLYYLPKAMSLPVLNDISTDTESPPGFIGEAGPPPGSFMAAKRDGVDGDAQRAGYPDLRPIVVGRTVAAAFDTARAIAEREGLDIVVEQPPRQGRPVGVIQAVDETLVMGFRDDIVIRVRQAGPMARIDLRSASRYGSHDFGRNADRIRTLSRQLRARLDFELPTASDDDADIVTKPAKTKVRKKKKVRRVRKSRSSKRRRKKRRRPSSPKVRHVPKRTVPQQG